MLPSTEQQAIVNAVAAGHSVIVNAVAGSGKTTTVLAIAEAIAAASPDTRIMQVTYNKQLKFEVRDKAKERGLSNITVHTYHSLAVNHYCSRAYDDVGIARVLARPDEASSSSDDLDLLELAGIDVNSLTFASEDDSAVDDFAPGVGGGVPRDDSAVDEFVTDGDSVNIAGVSGGVPVGKVDDDDIVDGESAQQANSPTGVSGGVPRMGEGGDASVNNPTGEDGGVPRMGEGGGVPRNRILIIDETQDMTPLYYALVRKYARENDVGTVVLLGDEYQSVYDFKRADRRFLTLGDRLWPEYKFVRLTLNTSYRLTAETATYINRAMLGQDRIVAVRSGPRVSHVHGNIWDAHVRIMEYLRPGFERGLVKPGDVFVLATSVRNARMPIRRLEHALVHAGIPCYVPGSDDANLDSSVIAGKVVFTTFHQSKGRERDIVILYGLDDGYCTFFGGGDDSDCPAMFYVAATRARKKLVTVEGCAGEPQSAPFMKMTLEDLAKSPFTNVVRHQPGEPYSARKPVVRGVTDLVRYLDDAKSTRLEEILGRLYEVEEPAGEPIGIVGYTTTRGGIEEVADINGIVIPMMFERTANRSSLSDAHATGHGSSVESFVNEELSGRDDDDFFCIARSKLGEPGTVEWMLRIGVLYASIRSNLYFRIAQIDDYNWLTMAQVDECLAVVSKHVSPRARFEQRFETVVDGPGSPILLQGVVDAIDDCADGNATVMPTGSADRGIPRMPTDAPSVLWEFKCTNDLTIEHKLQLAIYAVLAPDMRYKLLNIRTGEVLAIRDDPESAVLCMQIVQILLDRSAVSTVDDEEFVRSCLQTA